MQSLKSATHEWAIAADGGWLAIGSTVGFGERNLPSGGGGF